MKESERLKALKEDLQSTVEALSETYEELSLIYRFTEEIEGLSVNEICGVLLDEVAKVVNAETACILFYDEKNKSLKTNAFYGLWSDSLIEERLKTLLIDTITKRKPYASCQYGNGDKEEWMRSVLVVPIKGKKSIPAVLVVANKTDGEFLSGEVKLITTLCSLAGLFIENALLSEQLQNFLLSSIRAFVKVLESTSKWTAGHTERVTDIAVHIGMTMGLSHHQLETLKICALLHDIGKIAVPKDILDKEDKLDFFEWDEIRKHPQIGADILAELTDYPEITECIRYHHEYYNGDGLLGLRGDDIPLTARIIAVADAFDAMTSDRPYRKRLSVFEAIKEIRKQRGKQFDPQVVDAFLKWFGSAHSVQLSDLEFGPKF
ncbi:MAG: HD domain-containing protein [Nitrospirae bacterium]|nr:MAG: HD domain-containing protein [Nitrospirota bacterium]